MPVAVFGFIGRLEREDHFQAHNHEFAPAFATAEAYEAAGIAFLSRELAGKVMECVRGNGDIVRFDPQTDEFAVCDRDGILRTYYKPDPAIHKQKDNITYFRGQCSK